MGDWLPEAHGGGRYREGMGAGLGEWGRGGQPGAEMKRGLVSALWAPTQRPLCQGATKSRMPVRKNVLLWLELLQGLGNDSRSSGVIPHGPGLSALLSEEGVMSSWPLDRIPGSGVGLGMG